jgi:diguanylate cyclase (GGDEF)-like protein
MRLYYKILLTSVIPIFAVLLAGFVEVRYLLINKEAVLVEKYSLNRKLVSDRLNESLEQLVRYGNILSDTKDVVTSIRMSDNEILYNWGKNFIGPNVDSIIFTDLEGIVISRAEDEFRFGDRIPRQSPFFQFNSSDIFFGIGSLDPGTDSFLYVKKVKMYGEIPVGYIILSLHITPELLQRLSAGAESVLKYGSIATESRRGSPFRYNVDILNRQFLSYGREFFLEFDKNKELANFAALERIIFILFAFGLFFIPLLVHLLLKMHLKPYKHLGELFLNFAGNRREYAEIKQECERISKTSNDELSNMAGAISRMVSLVATNEYELNAKTQALKEMTHKDSLTGLYNRLYIENLIEQLIAASSVNGNNFSVMVMDIDMFKSVNDTFGHDAGDSALREFAETVRHTVRKTDTFARWGGDEFLLISENTEIQEACAIAEKIRAVVENTKFSISGSKTCSIGVAEFRKTDSFKDILKRADNALYAAKAKGRNRVEKEI